MKIGLIGAGNVGAKLGQLLKDAGYKVSLCGSDTALTAQEIAALSDVVILALPYTAAADALAPVADALKGKIVVDATNPLQENWAPLDLGADTSGAEEIAKLLPDAQVVKAFNTVFADTMTSERQDRNGQTISAFVAGDEAGAVATVAKLAADMGFAPVTLSALSNARYLEAMAHLNIALAVGEGGGTNAAFLYHRAV